MLRRTGAAPSAPGVAQVHVPPSTNAGPAGNLRFIEREFEAEADDGTPICGRGWVIHDLDDVAIAEDDPLLDRLGIVIFKVAGVTFRPAALQASCFNPGCEVKLIKEPQNPVDKKAIAVWDAKRHHHLGYVPKDQTWRLHLLLDGTSSPHGYVWWDWHKSDGARCGVKIVMLPAAGTLRQLPDFASS